MWLIGFLDNEFGQDDVNKFQSLATGPRHVATLDSATRGGRAGSARYRDIMAPLGLGDELRAALLTPSGCWGHLCLHRAESPYGFTRAEVRMVGRLAASLGNGCRLSLAAQVGSLTGSWVLRPRRLTAGEVDGAPFTSQISIPVHVRL